MLDLAKQLIGREIAASLTSLGPDALNKQGVDSNLSHNSLTEILTQLMKRSDAKIMFPDGF